MSKENKKEVVKNDEVSEINPEEEGLAATGQVILGEIEKIGGILTANPEAQAQGDYNMEIGRLRQKVAEELVETEPEKE